MNLPKREDHYRTIADDILDVYLRRLDKFLVPRTNKLLVFGILTTLFFFGVPSFFDLPLSLIFAALIEWSYISSRKYGWLDTIEFMGVLPFMLIGATISMFVKSSENKDDRDRKEFASQASMYLRQELNEVYSGKIIETHIEDGQIYVTVETPYGLHIPPEEIITGVAKKLHISTSNIIHDTLSSTRSYYMIRPSAMNEFEEYRKKSMPIESFSEIKRRILCQSEVRLSQI